MDKTQMLFTSIPPVPPKKTMLKRKISIWVIYVALFFVSVAVSGGTSFIYRLNQTLPTLTQMQNIEQSLVSRVFGKDNKLIHEFSIERRIWVSIDKIPLSLQNAVLAIEDRRFYQHWGIDVRRIFGAVVVDLLHGGYAQGASTITQQLARNVYLTSRASMIRKIREALTAVQLEKCYSKKEILELYLNQVYLGAGVYGVQAASEQYFSKPVSELSLAECALIAGLIQIPERYRPDKPENIARITSRRNTVLRAMHKMKFIDRATRNSTIAEVIIPAPKKESVAVGAYFLEMVRKHVSGKYGDELLYHGGLTIYTTLDPVAQDSAEKSMARQVVSLQNRLNRMFAYQNGFDKKLKLKREFVNENFDSLYKKHSDEFSDVDDSLKLRQAQMAVVGLEASTGALRVLIGGRDFDESKFNRAISAKRQPGSAFKPVVYTAAIENGFSPASVVFDQPITLLTPVGEWRPENYDRTFNGPMTLRSALAKSSNLIAIQVLMKVGIDTVVQYARNMGFQNELAAVPALAIGACEATPMEITSAYSIFPNQGIKAEPYFIEKIVDKNGQVLEEHVHNQKDVIASTTAFLMSSLMKSVVCCGTGASIRGLGFSRPAAGKTGTTNDYSDAWFIGFTPQISCGVWAGVDERRSLGNGVTGSIAAIPVWVDCMKALHRDLPISDFAPPEGVASRTLCKESHLIASSRCTATEEDYFYTETEVDTCGLHLGISTRKSNESNLFGAPRQQDDIKKKRPLVF